MYIEKINGPEDVKKIEVAELPKLAEEMQPCAFDSCK